jgi:hypothetical protein
VLAQTHRKLELVISDNASSDDTESLCRALCERDPRVRYLRSPANRGPTANFNTAFGELRGDYVMVLSDDDWIDEDYVASCLAQLRARTDLVLACGVGRQVRDGVVVSEDVDMRLEDDSPGRRVLASLRKVDVNGLFYGLMPQAVLRRAGPLHNVLGNDWLLVAAIVAQGKAATITTTAIYRDAGGTSADLAKLTTTLGLPRWQARVPDLVIAWQVLEDIGWRAPVYGDLVALDRARLALASAWTAIRWRSLAWHLTMPTFAALGRRQRGHWLWRVYLGLAQLGGRETPNS